MKFRIKNTRRSLTIQVTLIIFLITLSIYLFMQSDYFNLENIEVVGNNYLTKDEIIEIADITPGTNIIYFDLRSITNNLELQPMLKQVRIHRRLPDTIIIRVVERNPYAIIPHEEGFIMIDDEFVILKKLKEMSSLNLPVITGVTLSTTVPGTKIGMEKLKIAKEIMKLIWEDAGTYFSEINISEKNEIRMYTNEGIEVRFGEITNLKEKFNLFENLYQEKIDSLQFNDIDYIDVSFNGLPVIKYKN